MKFLDTIDKSQNIIILVILILIFILIMIPVIQISQYNVPSADDYTYGQNTYKIWKNTHNIFLVIKEAINEVTSTYINWQGTFSAVFLFTIQPGIFGLDFYKITTTILLTFFIISNIFLVKTISKVLFNYNKNDLPFIISFVLIMFSLEYIPFPRESLFWWNGASFYTLFYSIMLISISLLIRLIKSTDKKNIIINTIISVILTIILGGGNYCTALQYVIILFLLTILCFYNKNNNKWNMLTIAILGILSLIISIIAPGNSIRQANYTDRIGPLESIFKSLNNAIQWCKYWTNWRVIIMFLIIITPTYQIIKTSKFNFKYPIIFTILTFGIYASQQVPTMYAMKSIGPERAVDIYYYSYYWFIFSNIVYYLGWIKSKKINLKLLDYLNKNILPYTLIMMLIFLIVILYTKPYYLNTLTYMANKSIKTGEAQIYREEILERYKIYEDNTITDVILKPLTKMPSLLCGIDLQKDKNSINYWVNEKTAKYFDKNSVNLEKTEQSGL